MYDLMSYNVIFHTLSESINSNTMKNILTVVTLVLVWLGFLVRDKHQSKAISYAVYTMKFRYHI